MMFLIIAGSTAFSQILAFSGASRGLTEFSMGLPVAPIVIIIAMQIVGIVLGMFIGSTAIIMMTIPIFMPIVLSYGFDPLWFGVVYLINMQLAPMTPPFGLDLFVMKSVAPPNVTMGDIFRAAIPFSYLNLVAMALILAFPVIALWLPKVVG